MTPKSFTKFFYTIRANIAPYFKDILLSDLTAKMIEEYKLKRLDDVKPVTVRNELKILRSMLSKAIRWKYLPKGENPMDDVERMKVAERDPAILTPEEVQNFFSACSADFLPLAMVYYFAGLRKSEAFILTWEDIMFEENKIRIRGEVSKNKRTRYIPMNSKLRETLQEQKAKYGNTPWVFPGQYGQQRATCQNAFRKAREKAGIDLKFRLHDMRHTWASHCLHKNIDPKLIQEWAGWHSIKLLDRYGHPDRRHQAEKINRLG